MDRCEIRDSSYDVLGRPTWIRKSKKHLDFLWILWGRDRQPVNPFKWAPVRKSILQSEQNLENFSRQNSKNFYSFSFCTQLMGPLFSVLHLNQGSTDRQITSPNWSEIFKFLLIIQVNIRSWKCTAFGWKYTVIGEKCTVLNTYGQNPVRVGSVFLKFSRYWSGARFLFFLVLVRT